MGLMERLVAFDGVDGVAGKAVCDVSNWVSRDHISFHVEPGKLRWISTNASLVFID